MTSGDEHDKDKATTHVVEAPITLSAIQKLLEAMKAEMVNEVVARVETKNASGSSTTSPIEVEGGKEKCLPNTKPLPSKPSLSAMPPPSSYLTQVQPSYPDINNQSAPPRKLDSSRFINWRNSMESYVRSSSVQLWRIIKDGFKPLDPNNLTAQEVIDEQLDTTAQYILERAMNEEDVDLVRAFKIAKDAWDYLESLYE